MRNLKKILALVLALVMSLSLMATASATEATTAASGSKYQTAIDVLKGLGVVKGDEKGDRPTDSITRAEVAALLYRIDTTDVDNTEAGIYTGMRFTDVNTGDWYTGYISYCYNAEIIKGNPDGTFEPDSPINGYATLAMILRAMGYGKNGEFVGDGWEIRTASTAKQIGILDGISDTQLSGPAARELVFEILFRALLEDVVEFDARMPYQYPSTGVTLGYKQFKLEENEGVVVANEYANLNTDRVLDEGKTQLQVAGEDTPRTLSIGTEITDIGESRLVYTQNTSKVLSLADTGKNKVTSFGHACDISTDAKFKEVAEMSKASDIEYYVNFEPWTSGGYDCDQRLEFSVVLYGAPAETAFDRYKNIDISEIAADDPRYSVEVLANLTETATGNTKEVWVALNPATITGGDYATATNNNMVPAGYDATTVSYGYPVRYTKIIWANRTITDTDLTVLESIFGMADNVQNNVITANRITGDVFVGTKSTNSELTDEERDLSNTISYKKFYGEYINDLTKAQNWEYSFNGDWVEFIDNNGDGKAEYAFRTRPWLDEALQTYTNRNGDTVTEFYNFDDNTLPEDHYAVRYMNGETPAIGDKVIAAYIDNQVLVEPAKDETVTVTAYSWRNDEITTDKGTYGQSSILNRTDMLDQIHNMDDKTKYVVYFDHFGYVRAYELPGGTQYALLTELYYTNMQQGNIQQNWPMTVELTMPNEDGEAETREYNVVSGASTFQANVPWLLVDNLASTSDYNNWLQPALPNLGVTRSGWGPNKGTPAFGSGLSTFWPANRQLVKELTAWSTGAEFNYGTQNYGSANSVNSDLEVTAWDQNQAYGTASFTNIAVVNVDGDDVSLAGAAQLRLNKTTAAPVGYAVNYIQLDRSEDVVAGAVRYPIGGSSTYVSDNNEYVNAVHDTEFYIAYNGDVYYFKDFVNMPKLTNAECNIHAAYAVARDTHADVNDDPYWVADVIVYEVSDLPSDTEQTSVSLAYYTPSRLSGTVQQIETLNSKYGPMVTLTPGGKGWNAANGQWGNGVTWDGYGFYALNNDTEPVDNVMTARSISRIGIGSYTKNFIYAGTVTREAYIAGAGYYIDVDMGNGDIASIEITDKIYSVTEKDDAQSDDWYDYNEAELLRYQNVNVSQVKPGDYVIWVNGGAVKAAPAASTATRNNTKFVVDLGSGNWYSDLYAGETLLNDTPQWLISHRWIGSTLTVTSPATTQASAANQGEWQRIMYEQLHPTTVSKTVITFDLGLTGSETISFSYDGNNVGDKSVYRASDAQAVLEVPGKDLPIVELKATVNAGTTIGAIPPAAGSIWKVASLTGPVSNVYTLVVYDSTQISRATPTNEVGTIYTVGKINAMIALANNPTALTAATLAQVEELDALPDIKAARAAAGGDIVYGDITGDIDAAITAAGAVDTSSLLTSTQTSAKSEIAAYESTAVADLPAAVKETLAAKKTAANEAIDDADGAADIEAAVKAYKDAVDAALAANDPTLETTRANALAEVAKYEADKVAALTGAYATAVASAKTTAVSAINAAKTAAPITAALAGYKEAVTTQINAAATAAETEAAAAALAAQKAAAAEAVAAMIPTTPAGIAADATVVAKKGALDLAIESATAATLTNYYADGKLVTTNSLVAALQTAIDAAIAAAAASKAEIDAANALIESAVSAIGDATITVEPVTTAAEGTKPTKAEIKTAIETAVAAVLTAESISGVTATATVSGEPAFTDLAAGNTGITVTYSLSVADDAGKGTADETLADMTATVKWYLTSTGAQTVLSGTLTNGITVEASALTGGSEAADFAASVKSRIETALPGSVATITTTNTTWTQSTPVTYTYSVTYPTWATPQTAANATVTLG